MSATSPPVHLPARYRISRKIASGGMATVYATQDTLLGRLVAVKVLATHFAADEGARERFQREARAAARVSDHPHVVTIYDIGEHDGMPFIVMEYFPGGTLGDRLRSGAPVPRPTALAWLDDAASALDHAHRHKIVHRDVKPGNLLLDDHGNLAVGDFGIARMASEATHLTQTGQVMGTAAYLSPEQALGRPATAASDRYALAVVAYELLAGRRPFLADQLAAQARAHVEAEPPPASETGEGLPRAVDHVLWRGLEKDPDARWPTARAMVEALGTALDPATEPDRTETTRAIPARAAAGAAAATPRTPRPRNVAPRTPPPRRPSPPPPAPGPRRRGWLPLAMLAIAALLVGGAIALATAGGDDPAGENRAGSGDRSETTASDRPRSTADEQQNQPAAPAEQTPAETQPPPQTDAQPQEEPAPAGDPAALQAQGHEALVAGDYNTAIPVLQQATADCPVAQTDPCAYAYYDLGSALLAAGRPQEAIQALEVRAQNPDQSDTVQATLNEAYKAAGQKKPGKGKKND